jgi:hypothetical protein
LKIEGNTEEKVDRKAERVRKYKQIFASTGINGAKKWPTL